MDLVAQPPRQPDAVRVERPFDAEPPGAVEPCLARVSSPEVAAGLRAWTDLKPELLRLPVR